MGAAGAADGRFACGGMEALESRLLLANSAWAYPSMDGTHLLYRPTPLGDRIIDHSRVGYRSGEKPIPKVPTAVKVSPGKGDDTRRIQDAIDAVAALPLKGGFRGAVYLRAGTYQIGGRLAIDASGIVLRGAGDGPKGTRLLATGDEIRPLIEVNGPGGRWTAGDSTVLSQRPISGTRREVADKYVPAGARSFHLDDVSGFEVGDRIVIIRPSTQAWLDEIEMSRLHELPWLEDTKDLEWERIVTRVEGDKLTLDDPITTALDERYGGGIVYRTRSVSRIRNVGIEDLRGDSTFEDARDETHAEYLVRLQAVENAWVRRVTAEHFVHGLVVVEFGARSVTIERAVNLSPVSPIEGGYRYAFNVRHGEKVLVRDCKGVDGRHDYLTGFTVTGPIVFVDSVSKRAGDDVGPHHRWASGVLFDNIETNERINVRNRGERGPGHGWAGANVVVWNSVAKGGFVVRNPPTAQNWLIGSRGPLDRSSGPDLSRGAQDLPNAQGTYDSHGQRVKPRSLYYAQVRERAAHRGAEYREYWAGDIDGYVDDGAADDPQVSRKWAKAVGGVAGRVRTQDDVRGGKPVAFSFAFDLAPGERVVGASLSVGLRRTEKDGGRGDVLIDSPSNALRFGKLGWDDLSRSADGRVIDLNADLKRLQDGLLNVALRGAVAVDWAILNIRVSRPSSSSAKASPRAREVDRVMRDDGGSSRVDAESLPERFGVPWVFGTAPIGTSDGESGDAGDEVLGGHVGDLNELAVLR